MKSAISVELDGATFALDERAYSALRSYLDRAGARLGVHPDRAEVLAGLERSIAAKLRQRGAASSGAAIDEAAMLAALKGVGRVDGPAVDDSTPRPRPSSHTQEAFGAGRGAERYWPPPRGAMRARAPDAPCGKSLRGGSAA